MTTKDAVVYVVDDDADIAVRLRGILRGLSAQVIWFESPRQFLGAYTGQSPACLILDVRLSGMTGLDLLGEMRSRGYSLPTVILSSHGEVSLAVRAMQRGASDFFDKNNFDRQRLIDSVRSALLRDEELSQLRQDGAAYDRRVSALTPREREVMELLVSGKTNKVIAFDLGLSPKTIETHRTKVFQKMQVRTLVELTRKVVSHQLAHSRDPTKPLTW